MSTTHYSDAQGNYIGGFGDGATPPAGAIERPAPNAASDTWNGSAWVADPAVARGRMIVSKWQAKEALRLSGLLEAATAAVNAADARTQLAWSEVQQFERNSPTIAALAGVLGLTDTQVDDLFTLASAQSA
jgi:hypothetical protein